MELNDFLKKFASVFEETPIEKFSGDTKYMEMEEWGSLVALSVIAMVDDEYEVELQGDDIRNSNTINDLFEIIKSRL